MDDAYRRYREELEALDGMLGGIGDTLDQIAKRMADRARLAYPNEADVSDLNEIHERLTANADKIIHKMQSLHKEFNRIRNNE